MTVFLRPDASSQFDLSFNYLQRTRAPTWLLPPPSLWLMMGVSSNNRSLSPRKPSSKIRLWERQAENGYATNTFVNYTFSPFCLVFSLSSFPLFYLLHFYSSSGLVMQMFMPQWAKISPTLQQTVSQPSGWRRENPGCRGSPALIPTGWLDLPLSPLAPQWAWNRSRTVWSFPPCPLPAFALVGTLVKE